MNRISGAIALGLLIATACSAQTVKTDEHDPKWSARINLGTTRIHSWDNRSPWMEARVGRTIGSRITSVDVGIGGGGSRSGFTALTGALEVRPRPRNAISPYFRTEAGFLGESDFVGAVVGAGAGLILRLSGPFGVRAGAAISSHGGARGPVTFYSGFEYRW